MKKFGKAADDSEVNDEGEDECEEGIEGHEGGRSANLVQGWGLSKRIDERKTSSRSRP